MRAVLVAAVFAVTTFATALLLPAEAFTQLPEQKGGKKAVDKSHDSRPTDLPANTKEVHEIDKHDKDVTLYKKKADGSTEKKLIPKSTIDPMFKIGVAGYPSPNGFVVWNTVKFSDKDKNNQARCPAQEIQVDFGGNGQFVTVKLERGDRIVSIDTWDVKTPDDVGVALNSASDPHTIEIQFVDYRSGNQYTGYINAARIKN